MDFEVKEINGIGIATVISEEIVIKDVQDALDLMANARYHGAEKIILQEKHLIPAFFDLKSRIAGEILQKFSNYNAYLAIIGEFSKFQSKSLNDFISESNKFKRINFVNTYDEAVLKLTGREIN